MRRIYLMAAMILFVSYPSFSQEFTQYMSRTDLFAADFPGEPTVKDITWKTEYGITLPGHVYSVENARGKYSATVIDYKDTEKIHTALVEECKKRGGEGDECMNDWRGDVQGSIIYAA